MSQVLLYQAKTAGAAVAAYRILKPSGGKLVQAEGPRDLLVAVCGRLPAAADGERIEPAFVGIADVEYGAAVNPGDRITSDEDGKAVAAEDKLFQVGAAGAAAATNIAIAGILTTDELVSIIATDGADVGATHVSEDGQVQCVESTAGKRLIVQFRRRHRTLGICLLDEAAAAGDIGPMLIAPGV